VSGLLGGFALLGPGRALLADGFSSLRQGSPNMNSLVAVGSTTSFSVGALSALVPGLGFGTSFLEEPVMLLAFELLGRALEARAKVGGGAAGPVPGGSRAAVPARRIYWAPGPTEGRARLVVCVWGGGRGAGRGGRRRASSSGAPEAGRWLWRQERGAAGGGSHVTPLRGAPS
jgi:Cu2+-exporting ATPase